jgi:hypothetical protein
LETQLSRQRYSTLDREVPAEHEVHLILDNDATHKTPKIHRWLVRHPASTCTYSATSA